MACSDGTEHWDAWGLLDCLKLPELDWCSGDWELLSLLVDALLHASPHDGQRAHDKLMAYLMLYCSPSRDDQKNSQVPLLPMHAAEWLASLRARFLTLLLPMTGELDESRHPLKTSNSSFRKGEWGAHDVTRDGRKGLCIYYCMLCMMRLSHDSGDIMTLMSGRCVNHLHI